MRPNRPAAVLIGLALFGLASILQAEGQPVPVGNQGIGIACRTTQFAMEPGQVHQAVVLQDPVREQTVLFDLAAGGALVSLKYRGIEHIWGNNAGAMLQMAIHRQMRPRHGDPQAGDYNPTQAGDMYSFSPVTGVACHGTSAVDIVAMMLDFNDNSAFYRHPLMAVWRGRVSSNIPTSYFTPYTIETRASWVRNRGSAGPKYYLRLDERITHLTEEKIGPFRYDFADYAPWDFRVHAISPGGCPCSTSSTNYIVGGLYRDEGKNSGLAIAIPSSDFPDNKVEGHFGPYYGWRMRSFHLGSREALDGIASKEFAWYVMAGPWRGALHFAQHFLNEDVAR